AISRELAHLGCSVVIASRKADRLAAAAEKLAVDCREGPEFIHTVCNIRQMSRRSEDSCPKIGQIWPIRFLLVNNGGGQFGWNAVIETNLTGTFLCNPRGPHRQWMKRNEWPAIGLGINCVAPGIIYSETAVANYGEQGFSPIGKLGCLHRRFVTLRRFGCCSAFCALLRWFTCRTETMYVDGAFFDVPEFEPPAEGCTGTES
uniref:Peroxisomal trans-2-enoyl-CoA reductase n=1 Tax=Macrostomum lignano TaxID=282301 RepID=A0A1I8FR33_9PLAT